MKRFKYLPVLLGFLLSTTAVLPPACHTRQVLVSRMPSGPDQGGPNIDILKAVARRVGADLKLVKAPFKRAMVMMEQGSLDIMAGLVKTPMRETYIVFISPPYKTRSDTVFFVRQGKADLLAAYEDLSHLKIGTTFGAKYFPQFDRDTTLAKEAVHQIGISFRMLLAGRIDTVVSSEGGGIDMAYKLGVSGKVEMARFRFSQKKKIYIGVSKYSTVWTRIPQIRAVVEKMVASGEFLKIYKAYYTGRNLPVPAM